MDCPLQRAGSLWDKAHKVGTLLCDANLFVHYPQRLHLDNGHDCSGRAHIFRDIDALLIDVPESAAFGARYVEFASQLAWVFAFDLQAIAIVYRFALEQPFGIVL